MARTRTVVWQTDRTLTDTRTWALDSLAPTVVKWGYRVEAVTPDLVTLVRRRRWPAALAGNAIAFWADRGSQESITIAVTSTGERRTRMTVTGDLPKAFVRTLSGLPGAVVT